MNPWLSSIVVAAALAMSPIVFQAWRRERIRRRWRALGPKLELSPSVVPARQLLVGSHRGYPVEVSLPRTGGSRLRLLLDAKLPEGFALTPQRRGLRGASEIQDLQVGQPLLDAAYLIQGANPAAVLRLMQEPAVREALLTLQQQGVRIQLTGQELLAPVRGDFDEEACRALLRDLARLASALRGAAEQHRSQADAAREAVRSEVPVAGSRQPLFARRDFQDLARLRAVFGERWTRHKALVFAGGFVGLLVGGVLWAVARDLPRPEGWDLTGLPVALVFIGASVAHGWSIRHQLLCPSCGNDVRHVDPDPLASGEEAQPTLSLDRCPHCDLRLR
ncbi:hypothetical protein [Corallococcus carmarthensis]|uniref:Uncharacterized protein n=1 Tax=Corallococcus carmarthensis TaxID=2316728 RepID=A0A3A8KRW2_9BACT|nr:hypothetical protein [Corallococcus carmarthensis]NOK16032.1 hypothetical protein [Corallococcus carmarthensis]RKH05162.1 hypothetical protein D7X32_08700 [Corallococcus carmarthensis]